MRRILILATAAAACWGAAEYTAAERRHWSFQKRSQPAIPEFTDAADRAWVKNPIDAFILARLKKEGLRPAPKADRLTLVRRVYFDLLGLPPTPTEISAFVNDRSPDAYEKLIERLLDNPHYGEHWGQHWLDVVRFAESDSFEYDTHRQHAWRFRDYVIQSFNADKPYDRFLTEQLAGDEIDANDQVLRIASGFNRLGPLRKNAGNQEVASSRNEVLTEMTNVVGAGMLGVTLGCARCHDHKFDPIRQKDYYRIQAYFASTWDKEVPLATSEQQTAWQAQTEVVEKEIRRMRTSMRGLKGEARKDLEAKLAEIEARKPEPLPSLFTVADDPEKVSPINVLARGDYQNKGEAVGMRPLGVLLPDGAPELPLQTKAPRTLLARWITDPDNPLTSRVMANRLWYYHFGRGIVATPNDFGNMGPRPTHPELLDWLANELIGRGWRIKAMHRLILSSSSYQQSHNSPIAAAALAKDPENKLLWRFSRRRLEAEEIRDAMLLASGKLNRTAGGPSIMVPVDKELINQLYKPSQWVIHPNPEEHNRRSAYLIFKRNLRLPFMEVFDAPDLQLSCPRREQSTHAPQALELLNGDLSNRLAEALADRLRRDAGTHPVEIADRAYRLVTGRGPTAKERQMAVDFLKTQPLREFALALFNLNAFLYVE